MGMNEWKNEQMNKQTNVTKILTVVLANGLQQMILFTIKIKNGL